MGLPIINRKYQDASIVSYDFIDALESLGYVKFYAINQAGSYASTRNALASQPLRINHTLVSDGTWSLASGANVGTYDWDLDFKIPQIVGGGPLFVSTTLDKVSSSSNIFARMDIYISKIGLTGGATQIAAASGAVVTFGANHAGSHRTLTRVEIPSTSIIAGEKLRVNTKLYAYREAGGHPASFYLGCDGANRTTTVNNQIDEDTPTADISPAFKNSTDLIVTIPFKIDI